MPRDCYPVPHPGKTWFTDRSRIFKPIGSDQRFMVPAFFPEDVHVEPIETSLLFHELVQAVQYKHLGLDRFRDRYVRGLLTRGSYEEIPLKKPAYEWRISLSETHQPSFR